MASQCGASILVKQEDFALSKPKFRKKLKRDQNIQETFARRMQASRKKGEVRVRILGKKADDTTFLIQTLLARNVSLLIKSSHNFRELY